MFYYKSGKDIFYRYINDSKKKSNRTKIWTIYIFKKRQLHTIYAIEQQHMQGDAISSESIKIVNSGKSKEGSLRVRFDKLVPRIKEISIVSLCALLKV